MPKNITLPPPPEPNIEPSKMSAKENARFRIWEEQPGATAAERIARHIGTAPETVASLAETLHLGRSTVTSALRTLESEGRAARTPGERDGGKRTADGWLLAEGGVPISGVVEDEPAEKPARKPPTPLRAEVAAFLASAAEPVSAHGIGKALDRSAGAVQNCLERLVESGEAVLVTEKPKSYRAA